MNNDGEGARRAEDRRDIVAFFNLGKDRRRAATVMQMKEDLAERGRQGANGEGVTLLLIGNWIGMGEEYTSPS